MRSTPRTRNLQRSVVMCTGRKCRKKTTEGEAVVGEEVAVGDHAPKAGAIGDKEAVVVRAQVVGKTNVVEDGVVEIGRAAIGAETVVERAKITVTTGADAVVVAG